MSSQVTNAKGFNDLKILIKQSRADYLTDYYVELISVPVKDESNEIIDYTYSYKVYVKYCGIYETCGTLLSSSEAPITSSIIENINLINGKLYNKTNDVPYYISKFDSTNNRFELTTDISETKLYIKINVLKSSEISKTYTKFKYNTTTKEITADSQGEAITDVLSAIISSANAADGKILYVLTLPTYPKKSDEEISCVTINNST